MAGFDDKRDGLKTTYLEGAQIAGNMLLTNVDWVVTPHFTSATFVFQNEEGIAELKISNPEPTKPFNGKTLTETKDFLTRKYSHCLIHIAKVFGILDSLPKVEMTPKAMCMALKEKLQDHLNNEKYKLWVKISKNNKGWAEVSQEVAFIELMQDNKPTSLVWTKYDKDQNMKQRVGNSTRNVDNDDPEISSASDNDLPDNVSTQNPWEDSSDI